MLDLATSMETDSRIAMIETDHEVVLRAPGWPGDTDFELVAFTPLGRTCEVVRAEELAADIGKALLILDKTRVLGDQKPDWYRRLELCADGVYPVRRGE